MFCEKITLFFLLILTDNIIVQTIFFVKIIHFHSDFLTHLLQKPIHDILLKIHHDPFFFWVNPLVFFFWKSLNFAMKTNKFI